MVAIRYANELKATQAEVVEVLEQCEATIGIQHDWLGGDTPKTVRNTTPVRDKINALLAKLKGD